jgi:hypothetical protein
MQQLTPFGILRTVSPPGEVALQPICLPSFQRLMESRITTLASVWVRILVTGPCRAVAKPAVLFQNSSCHILSIKSALPLARYTLYSTALDVSCKSIPRPTYPPLRYQSDRPACLTKRKSLFRSSLTISQKYPMPDWFIFGRVEKDNLNASGAEDSLDRPDSSSKPLDGRKPPKLGQAMQKRPQQPQTLAMDDQVLAPAQARGRRTAPVHQSRIQDRLVKVGEKDSRLKMRFEDSVRCLFDCFV